MYRHALHRPPSLLVWIILPNVGPNLLLSIGTSNNHVVIPIIPEFESVRECHVWSEVLRRQFKVVPYVVTVVFELCEFWGSWVLEPVADKSHFPVILSLCIVRIIQWRREIPGTERVPLIEALWRDGTFIAAFLRGPHVFAGVLYFIWVLCTRHTLSFFKKHLTFCQYCLSSMWGWPCLRT